VRGNVSPRPSAGNAKDPDFVAIDPSDNVATCIREEGVGAGQSAKVAIGADLVIVIVRQMIPFGHKVALSSIGVGNPVMKYGQTIGIATARIFLGDHVHVNNVESQRGRGDQVDVASSLKAHVGPWARWRKGMAGQ
jgi:altronate dehydratase small subunit